MRQCSLALLLAVASCAPAVNLINVGFALPAAGLGAATQTGPSGNPGVGAAIGAGVGYLVGSIVWFFACAEPIGGAFTMSASPAHEDKPWYCAAL